VGAKCWLLGVHRHQAHRSGACNRRPDAEVGFYEAIVKSGGLLMVGVAWLCVGLTASGSCRCGQGCVAVASENSSSGDIRVRSRPVR
jgi:hypothetical protein